MPGRSFDALQRSLAKGEVQPVYYFFGDEELLKEEAVRRIMEIAVEESTLPDSLEVSVPAPLVPPRDDTARVGQPEAPAHPTGSRYK